METLAPTPAPAQAPAAGRGVRSNSKRLVEAADVARLPPPGTVVPGSFAFTPDGKSLTYLKSESPASVASSGGSELPGGRPRVIARPPGGGRHRGERLRGRDPPPRAAAAPRHRHHPGRSTPRRPTCAVIPLAGRPLPPPRRRTRSNGSPRAASPEIDPQLYAATGPRSRSSATTSFSSSTSRPARRPSSPKAPSQGLTPRPGRVHRPGRNGPVRRLLVVARRRPDRLPGDRRTPHPALLDRPPGGRVTSRSRPTAIRSRARPMPRSGSASSRPPEARPAGSNLAGLGA